MNMHAVTLVKPVYIHIHFQKWHKFVKVRFQVLTAACMKMMVRFDIAPCSLVETDRKFRGANDGGSNHL
jgi:hypothetical protein